MSSHATANAEMLRRSGHEKGGHRPMVHAQRAQASMHNGVFGQVYQRDSPPDLRAVRGHALGGSTCTRLEKSRGATAAGAAGAARGYDAAIHPLEMLNWSIFG